MTQDMPNFELSFDRGTLLLQGPGLCRDNVAAAGLPGVLWDPRVAAFRAPAHRYPQLKQALLAGSVPLLDRVAVGLAVVARLETPQLRPYQREALLSWEMNRRRGVVVLPTGSGKTHVALAAMAAVGAATLVLVPTRVLLGQWVERIRTHYRWPVGVYGDGERSLRRITVCTFESAYRQMDQMGHRFSLLVVDEVHHFGSCMRAEALEMCVAGARLGLTATPPDEADALGQLDLLVGPVVCRRTISQLSGKYLAPYDHIRLYVELTAQERAQYFQARQDFCDAYRGFCRGGGRSYGEFLRLAMSTSQGRKAIAGHHRARRLVSVAQRKIELASQLLQRHRGDRTLIFTADNSAAYALSRLMHVPAMTCDIGRSERTEVLQWLRDGRVGAVASARVLNEGVDLPDVRVGIVVGGSHGSREHVQRVGRLLRPQRGKRAVVYEVVARDTFEVRDAHKRQQSLVA